MAPLKIVFIGCVSLSADVFKKLQLMAQIEILGVVTKSSSPINADFFSLEPLARNAGIPVLLADGNNQSEIGAFLGELSPDIVFCIGWSYLLKPDILAIPLRGIVGYHPSALPNNRGRHPLIWALALGLKETASTFYLMNEDADAGPILSQIRISISTTDNAASLYARVTDVALTQISFLVPEILAEKLKPIVQDHSKANVWRKRRLEDGCIDWRMQDEAIYNLVRALSYPYVGAHLIRDGKPISVWKAEIGPSLPINIEPGRIMDVRGRDILVKCYTGSVWLLEHGFDILPKIDDTL